MSVDRGNHPANSEAAFLAHDPFSQLRVIALSVRLALATGLAVTATALGLVLSQTPLVLAGSNGVPAGFNIANVGRPTSFCQRGGTLPAGTVAIRVSLSANAGPRVSLQAVSGSRVLAAGSRAAGWGTDETVTIAVARVARTHRHTRVCVTVDQGPEPVQVNGASVSTTSGREAVWLRLEYLRHSSASWASLLGSVAHRMGLAHAPAGTWLAFALVAAMLCVGVLASRPRIPRAGLVCAFVAFLNAACWSVITPPFQAPDEPSHFAYVQLLAETGRLPTSAGFAFSQEEMAALSDLRQSEVRWHPEVKTIASSSALQQLHRDLAAPLSRAGAGDAGAATGEPPIYYALETIPYHLGSSWTLLDRLELMRLLSALLGGLTALFCYLFVRESLPGAPWAWTVGGLAVALFPLFAFTAGAVTPDAMLFAISSATFYCLARAFRRGLTRRLGVAIGTLTAVGLLSKLNFIGLAPGVLLALAILARRGVHARAGARGRGRVLGSAALASAIAVTPACVYALHNIVEHHALLGRLAGAANKATASQSPLSQASYVWQLYLPRLPGMATYFPGLSPPRALWFDRAVGLYGWLDTAFPTWVYDFALLVAAPIALLVLSALIADRVTLRSRIPELLVYAAIAAGVLLLVGVSSRMAQAIEGTSFAQPRYLLAMLALFGALLALGARGAGRRWGPASGCLIVVLVFAHDLFSQLQVIARFYG